MGRRSAVWGSYARTGLPQALTASYDAANELTTLGGATLAYDANGNLTSDATKTYTWNARNQLASLAPKRGQTGATASFSYDALGRRSAKTINSQTTGFLYDGANVVQELTGGTPSANLLTGLGVDQTFERSTSSATRDYLTDALGSILALADPPGAVQTSYTYDPFGNPSSSGAPSDNPYQYTGRENDTTGLQYNRARYYNPTAGRFVSEDPLSLAGGDSNLYRYANGDPLDLTDPSGLQAVGGCASNETTAGRKSSGDPFPLPPPFYNPLLCSTGGHIPPGFPDEGFEERGRAGGGGAFNPDTQESWHNDLGNQKEGPHYDYRQRPYDGWRYYPDTGTWVPAGPNPGPHP